MTENFPERLNRRVPDIKSDKDLSIAVYQTNYLPGLTNGQPKLLSNNQIDMGDRSPDNETLEHNMNLKLASTNGFSSPDTLSPNRHLDLHMHRRYDFELFPCSSKSFLNFRLFSIRLLLRLFLLLKKRVINWQTCFSCNEGLQNMPRFLLESA